MYIEHVLYLSLSPEKPKHWSFLSWQRTRWWLHTTSRLPLKLLVDLLLKWGGGRKGEWERKVGSRKLEVEGWERERKVEGGSEKGRVGGKGGGGRKENGIG